MGVPSGTPAKVGNQRAIQILPVGSNYGLITLDTGHIDCLDAQIVILILKGGMGIVESFVDGRAHHNGAAYRTFQMGSKSFYLSLHGIHICFGLTNHKQAGLPQTDFRTSGGHILVFHFESLQVKLRFGSNDTTSDFRLCPRHLSRSQKQGKYGC